MYYDILYGTILSRFRQREAADGVRGTEQYLKPNHYPNPNPNPNPYALDLPGQPGVLPVCVRSADKNGNAMNLYPGTCPVDRGALVCVSAGTCS